MSVGVGGFVVVLVGMSKLPSPAHRAHESAGLGDARRKLMLLERAPVSLPQAIFLLIQSCRPNALKSDAIRIRGRLSADRAVPLGVVPRDAHREVLGELHPINKEVGAQGYPRKRCDGRLGHWGSAAHPSHRV